MPVNNPWWALLILAVVLATASFLLQSRNGVNLADEGFLWYGVEQTVRGAVPMRDFQSYDPGRYYWSAGGALFVGKGLIALRFSETAFQVIGLFAGLLLASRVVHSWWFLAATGITLLLWMSPSHKLFDHTLLLCGIWIAVRLIEQPSPGRIFAAGFFVGICAFFGRNHALYNFLAQAALLLYLACKSRLPVSFPQLGMWVAGIGAGLLPMISLFVCAAGFATSYIESIRSIFRSGTNLALPVPWPWRTLPFPTLFAATQFLVGTFLVVLPLFYLAAIVTSFFMRGQVISQNALFIACAFVGLFYLHHAFSRADLSHLAQVIHPFILGALVLPCAFASYGLYRWGVVVILIAGALITVGRETAVFQRFASRTPWERLEIGSTIFVPSSVRRPITCLQNFAAKNIPAGDGVLVAPFMPGLYPILNHESPVWDLVYLFSPTAEREKKMIRSLAEENVNWAIITDTPQDKRNDLRFSATHELLWQYLTLNFEPVAIPCLPPPMKVFRRRLTD